MNKKTRYLVLTDKEAQSLSSSLLAWSKSVDEGKVNNLAIQSDLARFLRESSDKLNSAS